MYSILHMDQKESNFYMAQIYYNGLMYGDEHTTQYPSLYSDIIKIITKAYISTFPCSTIKATLSPEPKDQTCHLYFFPVVIFFRGRGVVSNLGRV